MRIRYLFVAGALLAGSSWIGASPSVRADSASSDVETTYVVLAESTGDLAAAEAAVVASGGTVVDRNEAIGMLTVTSTDADFASELRVVADVAGVATNRSIGEAPQRLDPAEQELVDAVANQTVTQSDAGRSNDANRRHKPRVEPLADLQWDMQMIGATADGSYAKERGDRRVLVGVIDTGIDGSHPDIRPNFSHRLSRNFVTDRADLGDGEVCEHPSCVDPVDEDDDGHGTHVAGTIGAALNGRGMAGVAPGVTLVNIRAGQDSGYFLLESTVNALTYAGDVGIDVVNMSFYVDPWLFNCPDNPADGPDVQAEQRTIIEAMQRALGYARSRGVTLVAALGNSHMNYDDLGSIVDDSSPDFPWQTPYDRQVTPGCLDLPTMGDGVIGVSALGPSTTKADYSNWSVTYGEVSAPGGWFRDGLGTPIHQTPATLILAPYPTNVAIANEDVDPVTGESLSPFVIRDCVGNSCAYYQYLQGTSMAAPHATGVAALIVSRYGERQQRSGFGLSPDEVTEILYDTATKTPCPAVNPIDYTAVGRDDSFTATCVGTAEMNNIYGHGIVSAINAVSGHGHH